MSLSALVAALLYLGGIAAVIVGVRSLLPRGWSPHVELRPPTELRRSARIARIDDFRNRRIIEPPLWSDDDPGPTAA